MSQLTLEQRYTIQVLLLQHYSKPEIANSIGKDKSVVYIEISRNCDKLSGVYTSYLAQRKYIKRAREKPKRITFTATIEQNVNKLIKEDFSPKQIVGYCRKNEIKCVSIERIYQHIWLDKKNKE